MLRNYQKTMPFPFRFALSMKKTIQFSLIIFCLVAPLFGYGQKDTSWYDISKVVYLDSLTIVASRHDFSVEDFIQLVQEDRSMESAFQNIRFHAYTFANDIRFFDKKGKIKASYSSINEQYIKNGCRSMVVGPSKSYGKYFKRNGSYKYYTSSLYDRIFYTHGVICEDSNSVRSYQEKSNPKTKMEKQILELKKLIFNPGQRSEILFIGDKMEIFSPEMQEYYNYTIRQGQEPEGRSCYIFTAQAKEEYAHSNKIVVQYIESFFEKGSLDILARNYDLAYKTAAYQFDVKMKVQLKKINDLHIPSQVQYDGLWKIAGLKTENAQFITKLYDFKKL
jgi:hypothetical protein